MLPCVHTFEATILAGLTGHALFTAADLERLALMHQTTITAQVMPHAFADDTGNEPYVF